MSADYSENTTVTTRETPTRKAVYFPGLNALRYIAAAMVVFCHVEEFKKNNLLPNLYDAPLVAVSGSTAVTFFFVLSGFLISYLLLKEKEESGTIDVQNFYVRRALRIWPVYYFIMFLAFFILPKIIALNVPTLTSELNHHYTEKLTLYILFLPNIALWLGYIIPYASHFWSVGVEEQFYLLWPWVFKLRRNPWPIVIGIICGFLFLRIATDILSYHFLSQHGQLIAKQVNSLLNILRVDSMAFGALGAYVIYYKSNWFYRYCLNTKVELASLAGVILLMTHIVSVRYIEYDLYGIFFLLLITNISCNNRSLLRLDGKLWTFLGNISYSVYMYQYISIGILIFIFKKHNLNTAHGTTNLALHTISQLVTIVIAYISYVYLESPFLKLKKRFMIVKSTTDATTN